MFDSTTSTPPPADAGAAPRKARRKPSLSDRIWLFFAGVNAATAAECPRADITSLRHVGMSLLATWLFQTLAITAALFVGFPDLRIAGTIGGLSATLILLLDRGLIQNDYHRQGRESLAHARAAILGGPASGEHRLIGMLLYALPRLAIVLGYSTIVATLLATVMFGAEVKDQLRIMQMERDPSAVARVEAFEEDLDRARAQKQARILALENDIAATEKRIANPAAQLAGDPKLARIDAEISRVRAQIEVSENGRRDALSEADRERNGIDEREHGCGPRCLFFKGEAGRFDDELRSLTKTLEAIRGERRAAEAAIEPRRTSLVAELKAQRTELLGERDRAKADLAELEAAHAKRVAEFSDTVFASASAKTVTGGILTSVAALERLKSDPIMGAAAVGMLWAIKLFIICLESAAIGVRLLAPTPSVYAVRLASDHHREARRLAADETRGDIDAEKELAAPLRENRKRRQETLLHGLLSRRMKRTVDAEFGRG